MVHIKKSLKKTNKKKIKYVFMTMMKIQWKEAVSG